MQSVSYGDEEVIMKTFIDHRAPKTHEYARYIFATILEQSPLTKGANVSIDVIENQTPFPKLVEIPEGAPDTKRMSAELHNWEVRHPGRFALLYEFTNGLLDSMCTYLSSPLQPELRINITFNYVIDDPEKIYETAAKLGLKIPPVAGIGVHDLTAPPTFSENPPEIHWRGKIVPIPASSKQLCLCRVAFRKDVGEQVSWDEVADEIDAVPEGHRKTDWRSVYDAVYEINAKVKAQCGEKIFKTTRKSFCRTA